MNFGEAIGVMKAGGKVAREGWNGKGMHLAIQNPDEHSMNKRSYIYIIPVDGNRVPWTATQTDVLSEDWVVVE